MNPITERTPTNHRLSTLALWKAVALSVGLLLLALPLMTLPGVVADLLRALHPVPAPLDTAGIGIALSLSVFVALGRLLGVPLADVFVRRPGRSIVPSTAFGVLLVSAIVLTSAATVGVTVAFDRRPPGAVVRTVLAALLLAVWAGVLEEFLVRGYLLSVIGHRWNWPAAVLVTSTLFALLHHGHATDGPSLALYLGTTGVAGVLFALLTLATGTVWNAVAVHATWNTLFSSRVVAFGRSRVESSGGSGDAPLVTCALGETPPLLGGGHVALPESPLAILVLVAGVGVVVGFDRWRCA